MGQRGAATGPQFVLHGGVQYCKVRMREQVGRAVSFAGVDDAQLPGHRFARPGNVERLDA